MSATENAVRIYSKNFIIEIDEGHKRGSFEHVQRGDECAGSLWLDNQKIVDFDGVYEIPEEVEKTLKGYGYHLE